jgi:Domain of unknown function (DUF4189)
MKFRQLGLISLTVATLSASVSFMPKAGTANAQPVEQPQIFALPTRWAAFVYSPSQQRFGTSYGHISENRAVDEAFRICEAEGARDCELLRAFTGDSYGAIARAKDKEFSWAVRPSRELAETATMRACVEKSSMPGTCRVIYSFSARGDNAYGFNVPVPQVFAAR